MDKPLDDNAVGDRLDAAIEMLDKKGETPWGNTALAACREFIRRIKVGLVKASSRTD
jgi:hypothetical protein